MVFSSVINAMASGDHQEQSITLGKNAMNVNQRVKPSL